MFNFNASLVRRRFLAWILLPSMMCLAAPGWAHGGAGSGGGGGHGGGGHGGGHFGGGHSHSHSTAGHEGRHFGWLHFNFRTRAASRIAAPDPANRAPIHAFSSTSIRTIPLEPSRLLAGEERSARSSFRHQDRRLFGRFPRVHSSGCFFNGFNQVCFFEPVLPLFFASGFYFSSFDFGFDDDAMYLSGDLTSPDTMPGGVTADIDAALPDPQSTLDASAGPPTEFPGKGLDPRFFLLILRNGGDHVVTDYWVTDGYIEYVSRDGGRSHIPIEALDLQASVTANSYRGLPFTLRSASPTP